MKNYTTHVQMDQSRMGDVAEMVAANIGKNPTPPWEHPNGIKVTSAIGVGFIYTNLDITAVSDTDREHWEYYDAIVDYISKHHAIPDSTEIVENYFGLRRKTTSTKFEIIYLRNREVHKWFNRYNPGPDGIMSMHWEYPMLVTKDGIPIGHVDELSRI